jgi:hypothetical protein
VGPVPPGARRAALRLDARRAAARADARGATRAGRAARRRREHAASGAVRQALPRPRAPLHRSRGASGWCARGAWGAPVGST